MIYYLFDILILTVSLAGFVLAYFIGSWMHVPEPFCSGFAVLYWMYTVGFGVWRQGSSRPNRPSLWRKRLIKEAT